MLQLISGVDIPIPELQTAIHQPSILEISYIGEEQYFTALQMLCFNRKMLISSAPELENLNNFQIFMTLISNQDMNKMSEKKNLIISVFTLFFPKYVVQFLPNSLYFNNPADKMNFMIDENNFDVLSGIISKIAGLDNTTGGSNSGFNPKNKKAAEIAEKLMKGRARAAQGKGEKSGGVLSRYVSVLTIGLNSMSLKDCLSLTVYQLYDLIERYGLYTGWDLDIRARLAGGKPDSKPEDWMKNLH